MNEEAGAGSVSQNIEGDGPMTAGAGRLMGEEDIKVETGQVLNVVGKNGVPTLERQAAAPSVRRGQMVD